MSSCSLTCSLHQCKEHKWESMESLESMSGRNIKTPLESAYLDACDSFEYVLIRFKGNRRDISRKLEKEKPQKNKMISFLNRNFSWFQKIFWLSRKISVHVYLWGWFWNTSFLHLEIGKKTMYVATWFDSFFNKVSNAWLNDNKTLLHFSQGFLYFTYWNHSFFHAR